MTSLSVRGCVRPYGSETRALEDRIAAFDNTCLRRILRIPYTAHATTAEVRLRAGSPPQLLLLIQTRRLHFFWYVARTGDFHNLFRALYTSIRGLAKDWRRRPGRHVAHGYGPWKPTFSRATTDWTQPGDTSKIKDDGGSLWKRLRSSPGLARDDNNDDDDDDVFLGVFVWKCGSVTAWCTAVRKYRRWTATNNRCSRRPQETSARW